MPPTRIIKINTAADAVSLRDRLLRSDLTPEARIRAEAMLVAANPHIDIDRLRPGAVVVVPEAPELNTEATTALQTPLQGRKDAIVQQLKDLYEQGLAAMDEAAAERKDTAVVLKGSILRRFEAQDDATKEIFKAVRDRLSNEEKAASRQRQVLEADLKQSIEDVEELFGAFD